MQNKTITRQFAQSLLKGLCGLMVIFGGGTLGYRVLEGWTWIESFYMSIIIMSTVGTGEVHPLTPAGRIFTILLVLFGVSVAAYFASHLMEFLFQRSLTNVLWRKSMNKRIKQMSQHSIICGYGRTGTRVVSELLEHKTPFVIIVNDEESIQHLTAMDIPHISGDPADEEILEAAGIQRAGSLVAALDQDADNLYLTLTASAMRSDLRIIARIKNPESTAKFNKAGATWVISPIASGATQISQLISYPTAIDLVELFTSQQNIALEVNEIIIEPDHPLLDKSIQEIREELLSDGIPVAIRAHNGATSFNPKPSTRLQAEDTLITLQQPKHGML